ncbi:hypothetical protein [Desulfosporosinus metallidurans]|uniref:Uncharacterized protein n=1 Tax=Desulfosporosinus metallidurans TaxID=1888891 RepID=A0A1Q8QP42_9FIRM|nr:hypothetical protein [Desulfosporosinus metallidurans]OLN29058.1 hypothetical protein DSOL_3719 [Desulfosporosinus metallidurans]
MFLGRNKFLNQSGALGEAGSPEVRENTDFLNQADRPMPMGMQRFLAKKGINSSNDLFNRVQSSPRMPFRKVR